MYFGVTGTSVLSERFSKAGEVVAARRSNIKPKNVDMILFLNKHLLCLALCSDVLNFFVCLREGGSITWYGMVWNHLRLVSPTSKNQPPLTISNPSFDAFIQLYSVQSFPKIQITRKRSI